MYAASDTLYHPCLLYTSEQIEQYYKIPAESIIKFGANVNPLGLSATLKKDLAEHLYVITSYPAVSYTHLPIFSAIIGSILSIVS